MTQLPVADIDIDARIARAAIVSQFPEFAAARVTPIGEGWDNAVFMVGQSTVFRFPRRTIALAGVRRTCRILSCLAPQLPCPIPTPCWEGQPSAAYAHPFMGYARVDGDALLTTALRPAASVRLAEQLGVCLAALHQPQLHQAFAPHLPTDVHGPLTIATLHHKARTFLELLPRPPRSELWYHPHPDDDQPMPPAEHRVVHGDLHLRHVLVQSTGDLTGIIDWDDMHIGHPAFDLSLYWSAFAPPARPQFAAAYGTLPPNWLRFARATALYSCAALAAYAHHEGHDDIQSAAEAGFIRCLS